MSDNRTAVRKPSFLGGQITYNNDLWSADCVVKNISDEGAKLTGRNLPALPDQFDLSIPQRKAKYRVHVRWRDRDQIGVLFEHDYGAKKSTEVRATPKRVSLIPDDDGIEPLPITQEFAY